MISVIETGGKQYVAEPGRKITVDRLTNAVGDKISLKNMLGENSVTAEVVAHVRADKIMTRKFRNKTRSHKVMGHRQSMTVLHIQTSEQKTTEKKPRTAKKET